MARYLSVFFKNRISDNDFYKFIKFVGGEKQLVGDSEQGHLKKGESSIWFYYRGNEFNLDEDEQSKLNNIFGNANTEIFMEFSSDDESVSLGEYVCKKVVEQFGEIILFNDSGDFYVADDIKKALHIE